MPKSASFCASHLSVIGFPRHTSGHGRSLIATNALTSSRENIRSIFLSRKTSWTSPRRSSRILPVSLLFRAISLSKASAQRFGQSPPTRLRVAQLHARAREGMPVNTRILCRLPLHHFRSAVRDSEILRRVCRLGPRRPRDRINQSDHGRRSRRCPSATLCQQAFPQRDQRGSSQKTVPRVREGARRSRIRSGTAYLADFFTKPK
jgi:hypothetical protein